MSNICNKLNSFHNQKWQKSILIFIQYNTYICMYVDVYKSMSYYNSKGNYICHMYMMSSMLATYQDPTLNCCFVTDVCFLFHMIQFFSLYIHISFFIWRKKRKKEKFYIVLFSISCVTNWKSLLFGIILQLTTYTDLEENKRGVELLRWGEEK